MTRGQGREKRDSFIESCYFTFRGDTEVVTDREKEIHFCLEFVQVRPSHNNAVLSSKGITSFQEAPSIRWMSGFVWTISDVPRFESKRKRKKKKYPTHIKPSCWKSLFDVKHGSRRYRSNQIQAVCLYTRPRQIKRAYLGYIRLFLNEGQQSSRDKLHNLSHVELTARTLSYVRRST